MPLPYSDQLRLPVLKSVKSYMRLQFESLFSGEHMEGKRMVVVRDLLFLYIVFNCVMGSFACFWCLSHYLCKWALCVIIKCNSAAEKCK